MIGIPFPCMYLNMGPIDAPDNTARAMEVQAATTVRQVPFSTMSTEDDGIGELLGLFRAVFSDVHDSIAAVCGMISLMTILRGLYCSFPEPESEFEFGRDDDEAEFMKRRNKII